MVRQGERTSTRQTFTAQRRGRASVLRKFVTASLWVVGWCDRVVHALAKWWSARRLTLKLGAGCPMRLSRAQSRTSVHRSTRRAYRRSPIGGEVSWR